MKSIILSLIALLSLSSGIAQRSDSVRFFGQQDWCGAHEVLHEQTSANLDFAGNVLLLDYNHVDGPSLRKVTIPVVVHVVYHDSSEIPTMEEIQLQIDGLNDDYHASSWDIKNVDPTWKKLVADTKISFKLATRTPKGHGTEGVTYTKTEEQHFTLRDGVKFTVTGGRNSWNTRKYLNVWICDIAKGTRGYAQFPGGNRYTDGVVVDYTDIGIWDEGNSATKPIINRILAHEVGHWLGLRHIWGDAYCGSDMVSDTPCQSGPHWVCPPSDGRHMSCESIDLSNNYMDYIDFHCMLMFTNGQKNRMWKSIVMFRSGLLKKSNEWLTK